MMDFAFLFGTIFASLQVILIGIAGFCAKQVWSNSILLASIDVELKIVCDVVKNHEGRLRNLEAA